MPNPKVVLETSLGSMRAELFEDRAPATVRNFVELVQKGFYNGLTFHRVVPGFMIQGGDPTGNGTGGPGYSIRDEFHPALRHDGPGILSMANAGRNTGGSQFFITLASTPWLDGRHSVFGRLLAGQEVAAKIAAVPRDAHDRPRSAVVLERAILE